MNESKKILFNKSMLLSLKAELLRKQEEVNEKKHLPQNKPDNFHAQRHTKTKDKAVNKEVNNKGFRERLKAVDSEDLEACRKSKIALQKKTELYEHLADSAGNSELASRFLVDFTAKKNQTARSPSPSPVQENYHDSEDEDSEWAEFTDCLGRTRKCLKSDLQIYKQKDEELSRNISKEPEERSQETRIEEPIETKPKPLLVQTTNDYLHSLREKWEQKEKELLAKDQDIHYQDLLFDEARIHGVGYYSFSTDEQERKKQMEELKRKRDETLKAQQEVEIARKKREKLIAARLAAAKARRRIRAGLPPEDPEEEKKKFADHLLQFLTQQKDEADAAAKEKEIKEKEELEKEREKLREAYVRDWDIGKEGVDEKVKKFREMTQEEYVEQQRARRIDEFAPPKASTSKKTDIIFDDKGQKIDANKNLKPNISKTNACEDVKAVKTWSDVRPKEKTPPVTGDFTHQDQKGLYFTTSKKPNMKYKNFIHSQDPEPILNELSDEENDNVTKKPNKRKHDENHAEIAPPPTFDYYGPIVKHSKLKKPFESDIKEAYAQGSKSLESKTSNRRLPEHYDFTFD